MLGGVLFVQDSVFEKNAATLLGGALYSFGTAMVSVAKGGTRAGVTSVNLKGVTFRSNTAETGGAIQLGSGSTLTMAGREGGIGAYCVTQTLSFIHSRDRLIIVYRVHICMYVYVTQSRLRLPHNPIESNRIQSNPIECTRVC